MRIQYFSIFFLLAILGQSTCSAEMVPFVIPAQQDADSLIAIQNEPIGGDAFYDRIVATGDHFTRGGQRIKFWGVNFSFGGIPPAEPIAHKISSDFFKYTPSSIAPGEGGLFLCLLLDIMVWK